MSYNFTNWYNRMADGARKWGMINDQNEDVVPMTIAEKGIVNMTIQIPIENFWLEIVSLNGGTGTNIAPEHAIAKFKNGAAIEKNGVAGHIANDIDGDNAIIELLKCLNEMESASLTYKLVEKIEDNYLLINIDNQDVIVKPTLLSTKKDIVEFTMESRVPIGVSVLKVKDKLMELLGVDVDQIVRINIADGYEYDSDHTLVNYIDKTYKNAVSQRRPTETDFEPLRIGGTTYAKHFPNHITFGPGFPGESSYAHRADE